MRGAVVPLRRYAGAVAPCRSTVERRQLSGLQHSGLAVTCHQLGEPPERGGEQPAQPRLLRAVPLRRGTRRCLSITHSLRQAAAV